jgi:hypothetical protein
VTVEVSFKVEVRWRACRADTILNLHELALRESFADSDCTHIYEEVRLYSMIRGEIVLSKKRFYN